MRMSLQASDNGASGSRQNPAGSGGSIEAREGSSRNKQVYGRWTRNGERILCFDVRSAGTTSDLRVGKRTGKRQ
jgi:hypothetical protein